MKGLLTLALAIIVLGFLAMIDSTTDPANGPVCTTDADCANWEVWMDLPANERCYGAPCPTKEE